MTPGIYRTPDLPNLVLQKKIHVRPKGRRKKFALLFKFPIYSSVFQKHFKSFFRSSPPSWTE